MLNNTRVSALALLAAATLLLAGCTSAPQVEPAPEEEATAAAAPERIAALDYESAEVLAELGLADHLVLIPEAVLNPVLGSHVDELGEVEQTFPVAVEVDAETVIALDPDLVVLSPRHGNEAPIADVLVGADVEVLELPDSWSDSSSLLANIRLIGEATGRDDAAETLATEIEEGLAGAESGPPAADAPRVIVLTNQAGRPFVTAGEALPIELLERAGANNVADDLGIDRTGPIAAEQLIEAAPDGIILIDMNGTGDRMFSELLQNPAVAALPALADDRVLRIEGKQVQAMGLTATIDGLTAMTEWTATL